MAAAAAFIVLVGAIVAASGVAVIVIAQRTADGRLGRNRWAGIRTRATRASDEAWLAAHLAGRLHLALAGWLLVAMSVTAAVVGFVVGDGDAERTTAAWGLVLGVGGVLATVPALTGAWSGHRAAVRVLRGD